MYLRVLVTTGHYQKVHATLQKTFTCTTNPGDHKRITTTKNRDQTKILTKPKQAIFVKNNQPVSIKFI
jgi:hypothetical protein